MTWNHWLFSTGWRRIAPLLATFVLAGSLLADDPAPPTRAEVNRLVRQLDADRLEDRDAAEQVLTALGPAVLNLLPATGAGTPAEVRQRLARIINKIEREAATETTTASRITLQGSRTLGEALRAFEEQSGNRVVEYGNPDQEVETDFQDLPYFEALDKLLDKIGMNVDPFSRQPGALALTPRPEGALPRHGHGIYYGVFRFEPLRVQAVRDLRSPNLDALRVAVRIEWEPRVAPILISQPVGELQATDDQGNSLSFDGEGDRGAAVSPGMSSIELDLPFRLPPRSATKLTIKGKLQSLIPGRIETFTFADRLEQSRGAELRKGGATVIVDRVRKNGDVYQLLMRVRFDEAANALESHRNWIYNNEAYLVGPDGQQFEHVGLEATRQEESEVGVAYNFVVSDNLDGFKFVYKTPAVFLRVPVEYELTDVPAP